MAQKKTRFRIASARIGAWSYTKPAPSLETDRFGHIGSTDGDGCIVVPDFLCDLADGFSRALRQIVRQRGQALNLADRHGREDWRQLQRGHRHGGSRARRRRSPSAGRCRSASRYSRDRRSTYNTGSLRRSPINQCAISSTEKVKRFAETLRNELTIKTMPLRFRFRHQPHATLQPCRQHGKAARQLFNQPAAYPAVARTQPGELQHGGPLQQRMANTARNRKPARFHGRHFHPRDQSLCQFLCIRKARSNP